MFPTDDGNDKLRVSDRKVLEDSVIERLKELKGAGEHSDIDDATSISEEGNLEDAIVAEVKREKESGELDWLNHAGDNTVIEKNGVVLVNQAVYVPKLLRARVLAIYHDEPLSGHPGQRKTFENIAERYWWPNLRNSVNNHVNKCITCTRNKVSRQKVCGLLQPLEIAQHPWESLSWDFIGGLPLIRDLNEILVVVDRFTKQAHFIPTKDTLTAEDLATLFISNIVRIHGLPKDIVSDRDKLFTSKFWGTMMEKLQIKRSMSTAFHPQSDGQTERTNQTLEQYLRCYCNYFQDNWVDLLPMAEFSYNNSVHASINTSPFEALYGYKPRFDWSCVESFDHDAPSAVQRINQFATASKVISNELLFAQCRMIKNSDSKRRSAPTFKENDFVWLDRRNIKTTRPAQKIDSRFIGPFKVIRKVSSSAYQLELPDSLCRLHPVFHVSLLKPAQRISEILIPELIDGEPEYEVQEIIGKRTKSKRVQYLVLWKNLTRANATWEPTENLKNAKKQ